MTRTCGLATVLTFQEHLLINSGSCSRRGTPRESRCAFETSDPPPAKCTGARRQNPVQLRSQSVRVSGQIRKHGRTANLHESWGISDHCRTSASQRFKNRQRETLVTRWTDKCRGPPVGASKLRVGENAVLNEPVQTQTQDHMPLCRCKRATTDA